jgi:hypothetical protein
MKTNDNIDVLQNLEFAIVQVWRGHPEMTDYVAVRAYEAAFQLYRSELRGHQPKPVNLTGQDAIAFESLRAMCEFRLGRGSPQVLGPEKIAPIAVEQLVDCLREPKKSVERHTRIEGRQGYLTFIQRPVPSVNQPLDNAGISVASSGPAFHPLVHLRTTTRDSFINPFRLPVWTPWARHFLDGATTSPCPEGTA